MSAPAPTAFEVDSRDRESSAATTSLGVALASLPRRRETRRCPFCDKLFCCVDCRRCHEIEKHPDRQLDCPLCRADKLEPGQIQSDELITHVVIGHLPLRCLLCGDEFKLYEDLRSPGPCKWWSARRHRRAAPQPRQAVVRARSTFTPPCARELATRRRSAHATELSLEGSGAGNYGNFTSPPVLFRNTSTPMHVGLTAGQQRSFEYKTPKFLAATDSQVEDGKGSAPPFSRGSRETDRSETRFVTCSSSSFASGANTPLRSEGGADGCGFRDFPARTDSGRWLSEATREPDETVDIADLTRGRGADVLAHESRRANADPAKRVRFSDQFQVVSGIADAAGRSLDATEELYQEARDSVTEMPIREGRLSAASDASAAYVSCDVLESALESAPAKGDEQSASTITDSTSGASVAIADASARAERSPTRSQILACRENERNAEKEHLVDAEHGNGASTEPPAASGQRSSASRVLMMVVVERNLPGSGADEALAPLIASSLRELEKRVSADDLRTSIPSPLAEASDGDSSSRNARKIVAVTTVDSYSSVSSLEYLDHHDVPASKRLDHFSATDENKENSGGIFSAVAQAMKSAFGKLSGTNASKDATKEPPSEERSDRASPSSVASTSSPAGLSTLASSLLQRPGKRSRDVIEGSLAAGPSGVAGTRTEARSPAAKRPRGWHRIRAREPLARMRSGLSASTRGISSETQYFQRGSLSVGDTVLPIPSRAHRSTQTD